MTNLSPTVSMADKVTLIDDLCAKARILPVITIAREQDILPLRCSTARCWRLPRRPVRSSS